MTRMTTALAGVIGILLAGCATTPRTAPMTVPADLKAACDVPKVHRNAVRALGEHRAALLACRDRHARLVAFIEEK